MSEKKFGDLLQEQTQKLNEDLRRDVAKMLSDYGPTDVFGEMAHCFERARSERAPGNLPDGEYYSPKILTELGDLAKGCDALSRKVYYTDDVNFMDIAKDRL